MIIVRKCPCGLKFKTSHLKPERKCIICRIEDDPRYADKMLNSGFDPAAYRRECEANFNLKDEEDLDQDEAPEDVKKEIEAELGGGLPDPENGDFGEDEPEFDPRESEGKTKRPRREFSEILGIVKKALPEVEPMSLSQLAERCGQQVFTFGNKKTKWRQALDQLIKEGGCYARKGIRGAMEYISCETDNRAVEESVAEPGPSEPIQPKHVEIPCLEKDPEPETSQRPHREINGASKMEIRVNGNVVISISFDRDDGK